MGTIFTKMFSPMPKNKEAIVLLLGRGNAGKTTIFNLLLRGEVVPTVATSGFNIEFWHYKDIKFIFWDVGGQTNIRYTNILQSQAVIFVVDSSDTNMLVAAKDDLQAILEKKKLEGAAILFFANKQDLPGALDDDAITEALELHKIKDHQWAIFKTTATKGEGVYEGLDWLSDILKLDAVDSIAEG